MDEPEPESGPEPEPEPVECLEDDSDDEYHPIDVDEFEEQFNHYWDLTIPRNDSCSEIVDRVLQELKRDFVITSSTRLFHHIYEGFNFNTGSYPIPLDFIKTDKLYECNIESYHHFFFIRNKHNYISVYQSLETLVFDSLPNVPGYTKKRFFFEYGKFLGILYGLMIPIPSIHSNSYRILTGHPYPRSLQSIVGENIVTKKRKAFVNHPIIYITEFTLDRRAQRKKKKKKNNKNTKKRKYLKDKKIKTFKIY